MNGHGLKRYSFHGHDPTRMGQRTAIIRGVPRVKMKKKKKKKNHHIYGNRAYIEKKDTVHRACPWKNRFLTSKPSLLPRNESFPPFSTSFILLFLIGRWANANPTNPTSHFSYLLHARKEETETER